MPGIVLGATDITVIWICESPALRELNILEGEEVPPWEKKMEKEKLYLICQL